MIFIKYAHVEGIQNFVKENCGREALLIRI